MMSEPHDATERNQSDELKESAESTGGDDTSTAEHSETHEPPERPAAPVDAKPHPGPHRV